ncbi:Peptidyl-prolyl cis-trans isomerase A precursor [Serratia plymuthica]|nr:Peptidyl-prolyl cis-trans isomerase A precursor [Serratia plymuthica]
MFKRTLVTFVALCSLTAMTPAAFAAGETHVMLTTSAGNIELALDSQKAPVSTKNFVDYVNSGYYNNTVFHRVIPGFMVQGGGFTADMQQKTANAPIKKRSR